MVVVEGAEEVVGELWGTWEELILGGAVLRHGTHDWNVIASELQARALYPFNFTPKVCKAKYEDMEHRYSGYEWKPLMFELSHPIGHAVSWESFRPQPPYSAESRVWFVAVLPSLCLLVFIWVGYGSWFEELKKRRVAELKKALAKSEDSIGSLESKLESLKVEKTCSNVDCSSNHTDSPASFQKLVGDESFGKDTSKDELSAESFTEETQPNAATCCHLKPKVLKDKVPANPHVPKTSQEENFPSKRLAKAICLERGFIVRKKRGKRKRKVWDVKEACVGENTLLGSNDKEQPAIGPSAVENTSCSNNHVHCSKQEGCEDLMLVLNAVLEDEQASIFQRRMDGQKRARYKKLIRRHMDLNTIRSRIDSKSITTLKELFRDLLLLANNALVFYSRTTREHKCAMVLRKLVTRKLRQHDKAVVNVVTTPEKAPVQEPPVERQSTKSVDIQALHKVECMENGSCDASKRDENVSEEDWAKGAFVRNRKGGRKRGMIVRAPEKRRKRPRNQVERSAEY